MVSGPGYKQATNAGAYFKTVFSGRSASATFDLTSLTTVQPAAYPRIKWRVDSGKWFSARIIETLPLARFRVNGLHTLQVVIQSVDAKYDQWKTPLMAVRFTGLVIDADAVLSAPAVSPKLILFRGDSITAGYAVGRADDSTLSWVRLLAEKAQSEHGQIGYTGMGWRHTNATVVPFFTPGQPALSSINKFSANHEFTLASQPQNVIIQLGANDVSDVTEAVTGALKAQRLQTPLAKIFVVIPFEGSHAAEITKGFAGYQRARDANAVLIDCHVANRYATSDGLHPNAEGHAYLAEVLWSLIGKQLK